MLRDFYISYEQFSLGSFHLTPIRKLFPPKMDGLYSISYGMHILLRRVSKYVLQTGKDDR